MRHEKKISPKYFKKILSGEKTYELRLADWICEQGDTLILREWDPKRKEYTGRSVEKQVTYVGRTKDITFWPEEQVKLHGYQIIAFR